MDSCGEKMCLLCRLNINYNHMNYNVNFGKNHNVIERERE